MKEINARIGRVLVDLMKSEHVGKQSAIRRADLVEKLRVKANLPGLSLRKLQEVIQEVLEYWHEPILCTAKDGCFFAANQSEVDHAINERRACAKSNEKHADAILTAWRAHGAKGDTPVGCGHCESRGG